MVPLPPPPERLEPPTEEELRERWLASARVRRSYENHSREEFHVRDVTGLLTGRGEFEGLSLEAFRSRLRAWRPSLEESTIARVTAELAYLQEPPAEGMECPEEWQEAFEAAEALRRAYAGVPEEVFARWLVSLREAAGSEEGDRLGEAVREISAEAEEFGITDELMHQAVGPDVGNNVPEEQERRLREILADFYYGEQGYRVLQHIIRLTGEGSA